MKKAEILFETPKTPTLSIDEKTAQYIEKVRSDTENDFSGPLDIKVDDFEGPLDLLLFLIKRAKIRIEDIFVSKITDQYLAIIEGMEDRDLEKVVEFIEIAAILVEIKSKSLLPQNEFEQEEVEAPKRNLVRKLEEYKLLVEASERLKERETIGIFHRSPEPTSLQTVTVLKDMTKDGLITAMKKLFERLEQMGEPQPGLRKIVKDRFTVEGKMKDIREVVQEKKSINFFSLFETDYSKLEIITTFQALLELLKLQEILAEQEQAFGDITIKCKM